MGALLELLEQGERDGGEVDEAARLSEKLFGSESASGETEIENLDRLFETLNPPPAFSKDTLLENADTLSAEEKSFLETVASRGAALSAEDSTRLSGIGRKLEKVDGADQFVDEMAGVDNKVAGAETGVQQAESELVLAKDEAQAARDAEQGAKTGTQADKDQAAADRLATEKAERDAEKQLEAEKNAKMKKDIKNSKGITAAAIGLATVALGIGGNILGAYFAAKYLQAAGGVLGAGSNLLSDTFFSICSSSDSLIHSKIGGIASLADLVDIDSDPQSSPSPSPSSPVLTLADCLASPGNPKYLDTSGLVPREVDDPENEYQRQRKRICDSKCITVVFSLIMDGIILLIGIPFLIWIMKDRPNAKIDKYAEWKGGIDGKHKFEGQSPSGESAIEQVAEGLAEGLAKSQDGSQGGGFLNTKKFKKINKYNKWLIVFLLIFAMIITHFYKKQRGIQKDQQYIQQYQEYQGVKEKKYSKQKINNNFKNDSEVQPYQPISVFGGQYL